MGGAGGGPIPARSAILTTPTAFRHSAQPDASICLGRLTLNFERLSRMWGETLNPSFFPHHCLHAHRSAKFFRACLKTQPKRRVRARGLQEAARDTISCRPGPLIGRVFK